MTPKITELASMDADQIRAVRDLLEAATLTDGVAPVSEHVLLHLRHGHDDAVNLLANDPAGGAPVGFAHLDTRDRTGGASAELAVRPTARRAGVAGALVTALELRSGGRTLRLWAHGHHPGARALAERRGYVAERSLWTMRRPLADPLPDAPLPTGLRLRSFQPGRDEEAWVAVNNRAFADHPEQGGWTAGDVRVREAEPWFDPAGFLLVERVGDGTLVGFHWTKVHQLPGGDPVGEVYVVGVDPSAQGVGLGRSLTVAGLSYLRSRGLGEVMLYVDESNAGAMAMYERLGFARSAVDVRYRGNDT